MLNSSDALTTTLRGILALIVAAALWQIAAFSVGESLFMPDLPPLLGSITSLYAQPSFWDHVWTSGERFFTAYVAAAIVGIPAGLTLAQSQLMRWLLGPLVSGLAVAPLVVLAPLLTLWFGIGSGSKVSLAIICAVFPLMNKIATGLTTTKALRSPEILQGTAQTLPSGMAEHIVAGLRVAVLPAATAVVVSEMIGSATGMGLVLMNAAAMFNLPPIVAVFLVLSVPVIVLVNVLRSIELRLASAS